MMNTYTLKPSQRASKIKPNKLHQGALLTALVVGAWTSSVSAAPVFSSLTFDSATNQISIKGTGLCRTATCLPLPTLTIHGISRLLTGFPQTRTELKVTWTPPFAGSFPVIVTNSGGSLTSTLTVGAVGPTGLPGTNGTNGTDGAAGSQGLPGSNGAAGSNGLKGDTGADGAAGSQGIQGQIGVTGTAGTDGATGAKGDTGLPGAAGVAGSNGLKGDTGAVGATGPQGIQGIIGVTGTAGTNGADGATGSLGLPGVKGDAGPASVVPGPAGVVGPRGAPGNPTAGTDVGDMQYWDGSTWVMIPVGANNTTLKICDSIPTFDRQCSYIIGDMGPAGGKVFYLTDATGKHGLEAAPADQSSGIPWGCYGATVGGTSTLYGTGQANTTAINAVCGPGTAASIAASYSLNGISDWYLPSKDELNLLYIQKNVLGGFADNRYWSSSEYLGSYAWFHNFAVGHQSYNNRDSAFLVRAVRAF
jgi:hypothetical protein